MKHDVLIWIFFKHTGKVWYILSSFFHLFYNTSTERYDVYFPLPSLILVYEYSKPTKGVIKLPYYELSWIYNSS